MSLFLDIILSFPTAIYTTLLGITAAYWMLVVLGALDLDLLGGAEGVGDPGTEGLLEGASGGLEGGADGAAEGLVDGAGEALIEGGGDGGSEAGPVADFVAFLGLQRVPVTLSLTLIILFAWLLSYYASMMSRQLVPEGALSAAAEVGIAMGAGVVSILLASLAVRPLGRFFEGEAPRRAQETLIGKVVSVKSTRVDDGFGQALYDDKGAGLILSICCHIPNHLKKGFDAVIVGFDRERNTYEVAPLHEGEITQSDAEAVRQRALAARARSAQEN